MQRLWRKDRSRDHPSPDTHRLTTDRVTVASSACGYFRCFFRLPFVDGGGPTTVVSVMRLFDDMIASSKKKVITDDGRGSSREDQARTVESCE